MPFSQVFPRSLTAPVIRAFAPALPGVYGVSNAARWLYIGATDNIQEALLAYCQQSPSGPISNRPSGFVFEVCERSMRSDRQTRLIAEYSPSGNASRGRRP
jgi:hypothetical protein